MVGPRAGIRDEGDAGGGRRRGLHHGTSTSNFQDSYGNQIHRSTPSAPSDKDGDGRFSRPEIPDDLARRWMSLMDLNGDGYLDEREWEYYRAARASQGGMWAFRLGGAVT